MGCYGLQNGTLEYGRLSDMKKIGHGKIPLTDYHMDDKHPVSLRVNIYMDKDGQIKLVYAPTSESNFLVVDKGVE